MFSVSGMIWLSVPFWCSFAMLDGLSRQGDDFLGSLRALYEEGVVQPLVFTITPREPSGLSWTTQAIQEAVWAGSRFSRQIKNDKNGY